MPKDLFDATVHVEHLSSYAPELAKVSTPDWKVYATAARGGFDGVVTRDRSQLEQVPEMYVLDRLTGFTVVTWRQSIEDPIREWGQLLAYLPEIKKRILGRSVRPKILLLPNPTLSNESELHPDDFLGREASSRGVSRLEVHDDARREIRAWLSLKNEDAAPYLEFLA